MEKIKFIELFAGIGGFRYGLERVRVTDEGQPTVPSPRDTEGSLEQLSGDGSERLYDCVWANEIDKYAASIYRKNYGGSDGVEEKSEGDVQSEDSTMFTGEPSQHRGHSLHNGKWDKRSKLYEGDITKIETKDIPEHDLLVGGFPCQAFSIAGRRGGFDDTRGTLFFEVARILRDKRPARVVLENVKGLLSHDSGRTFQTILKVLADIGYRVEWQVLNSKDFGVPQNRERVFIIGHLRGRSGREVFPIGGTNTEDNGKCKKEIFIADYRNDEGLRIRGESLSPTLSTRKHSETDISTMPHMVIDLPRVRRLTPTECERLQGFPDGWTEGVSDTQRYKQLGNAVTTNVITALGEALI